MSSLLNYYSQVDIQVKNFLALATTTVYTPNTNARIESLMSETSFTSATTSSTYASQTQFRDMGKFVMTFDSLQRHTGLYRLVQYVKGATTEGVPPSYPTQKFYIQVWAADSSPAPITVSRVG
jgi:hypothetical protein